MKEKAIDKRMASATVDIETCKKCERKFRKRKDDSLSVIYARALEDATRDVMLTPSDYEEIDAEMRRNKKAREAKRKAHNIGSHHSPT